MLTLVLFGVSPRINVLYFDAFLVEIVHMNAELAVGNIVRRVLHIIREEDLSLTTAAVGGLNLLAASDDDDDSNQDDHPGLSAAVVAAAARSTLRPPSLRSLLEDIPNSVAVPHTSSSGGDSEGKNKCKSPNSYMLLMLPPL